MHYINGRDLHKIHAHKLIKKIQFTCGANPIVAVVSPGLSLSLYPPNDAKCSSNSRFCCSNCCVLA